VTLREALRAAAADTYHQAWRLVLLNVALSAVVAAIVLAALAVRPAIILGVLAGPVAAALMHCVVTLAQTEDLRLRDAVTGLREHWRRGLELGALALVAVALGAVAVPFYARQGASLWPLAVVSAYLLALFAVFQLALWPLAVFESERSLRTVLGDAAQTFLRRPFGFCGLALVLLVVNGVGLVAAVLPLLTLTIAYSFLVVAHFALPKNPAREV
jgi:hypothetical protein